MKKRIAKNELQKKPPYTYFESTSTWTMVTSMFASGYLVIVIECGMWKELTVFSVPRDCCILVNSGYGAGQVV
jgi:hypothetical protein